MLLSVMNKASWGARFLKKTYPLLCGFPKFKLQHFAVMRPDYNGVSKLHLQFFLVTCFTLPVCGQKAFHQHQTLCYPAFWFCWMGWLTFWLVFEILTDFPEAIFLWILIVFFLLSYVSPTLSLLEYFYIFSRIYH